MRWAALAAALSGCQPRAGLGFASGQASRQWEPATTVLQLLQVILGMAYGKAWNWNVFAGSVPSTISFFRLVPPWVWWDTEVAQQLFFGIAKHFMEESLCRATWGSVQSHLSWDAQQRGTWWHSGVQVCPVDLCSVHLYYRANGSGMERELIALLSTLRCFLKALSTLLMEARLSNGLNLFIFFLNRLFRHNRFSVVKLIKMEE